MTAASALSISANNMEKFRPIKLDSLQTVLAMNATVRRDFKTMLDYSCIFIETLCGVTRNNPVYLLHYILQCGKSFIVHFIPLVEAYNPAEAPSAVILRITQDATNRPITSEEQQALNLAIAAFAENQFSVRGVRPGTGVQFAQRIDEAARNSVTDMAAATTGPVRRRRGAGGNNLESRLGWPRELSIEQKIERLRRLNEEQQAADLLTEAARIFVSQSIVPILGCLDNHCDGDLVAFQSRWQTLPISTFFRTKCKGVGECKGL